MLDLQCMFMKDSPIQRSSQIPINGKIKIDIGHYDLFRSSQKKLSCLSRITMGINPITYPESYRRIIKNIRF